MMMKQMIPSKRHLKRAALSGFSAVMITAGVSAQDTEGLTPDHVAEIKSVSAVASSHDDKHIAYTVSVPADPYEKNEPSKQHLYVYHDDSDEQLPYYTQSSVKSVAFRPKKNTVTFLTKGKDDKGTSLYEMHVHGGGAQKIFEFDRSISSYDWHPDGNLIAFTSTEKADKEESPLPYEADVYEENRPNREAFIADVTSSSSPQKVDVTGSVYLLNWSPSGDRLAFSVAPSPEVDDYYMAQEVKVADQKGKVIAEIENEGKLGQIEWDPKGNRLALRAAATINDPTDGRILIASADGGKPQIIDKDFEGKYEHISWKNSKEIHFSASMSTSSAIGTIRPDGSNKTFVFKSDEHVIKTFDGPVKKQIAFSANSPEHPTELFRVKDGKNNKPERITHLNNWLPDVKLGKQEVVSYTSRDGEFEIEGVMIYPIGYSEGTEIPVITVVHGGPEAHYGNGWLTAYSMPGQTAAAKGYGVFYPNYRGSTGRGIEFAHSSQGDLSGKEFDDVVDGVDHLIEKGIADNDRIGVTGGSYGGYASAWMSTYYSDRFAASVMFVGISNNLSKWGTSDIPDELFYVHARERMWESDEKWLDYLKRSPVYHVDKAQTPILIMHGAEDTRVHPAQSLELYRHLKVRKPEVPVRLVYYPGEGHGNRSASAQYDYNVRALRWFDTYLMSGDNSAKKPSREAPVPEK